MKQRDDYKAVAISIAKKMPEADTTMITALIDACYQRKVSFYDLKGKEGELLIDVVSYFRLRLGCMKEATTEELIVEANYLRNNWPGLSLQDVRIAIDLLTTSKLKIRLPYVLVFSTLLMGDILTAYEQYKAPIISAIIEQSEQQRREKEFETKNPTPAEQSDNMKEMVRYCYNHYKEEWKETFFNRMVYSFLRKTGRLKFSDNDVQKAKEYAKKEYAKWVTLQETISLKGAADELFMKKIGEEKTLRMRQYGVNYCLGIYFEANDIEKVIQSITEKDFTEKK